MNLARRTPGMRASLLALLVLLLGLVPPPAARAQQAPALPSDPIGCQDGGARTWTRIAGGPYPGRFVGARGIVLDRDGNLVVADSGNGRLQRLAPTGELLGIVEIPPERPEIRPSPEALAIDGAGYLYVADTATARVLKLHPDGTILATWQADPVEGRTRRDREGQVVPLEGRDGILLGQIAVGSRYLYAHFVVGWSSVRDPSSATQLKRIDLVTGATTRLDTASLVSPPRSNPPPRLFGLAADRQDTLYIAEDDQYGGTIRKVAPNGEVQAIWSGEVGDARLYRLGWITVGQDGNVYVGAWGGWMLISLTPDGQFRGRWQRSPGGGVAVDRTGTIYVSDDSWNGSGQIAILVQSGERVGWLGTPANAPGLIEHLHGFDLDETGTIVAVTMPRQGEAVLHEFTPAGQLVGARAQAVPNLDSYYRFRAPRLAPDGDLYALGPPYEQGDQYGVFRLTSEGEIVRRWRPDRAPNQNAPEATAYVVAPDETVYVADEATVYQIGRDGRQLARWRAEDVDRWAPRGRAFTATDLALDGAGNLYVGGRWFIYKIGPDGNVLARWGELVGEPGRDGGSSTFSGIRSLAVDPSGHVYVGHGGPSAITMLAPDGRLLARWGQPGLPRDRSSFDLSTSGDLRVGRDGTVYLAVGPEIWRLACSSGG